MRLCFLLLSLCIAATTWAQPDRWQQAVRYKMDIDMDVETNQYKGHQYIQYENNSPDELDRVFFHLYFNAFQPNSMMDIRSRTIADPDRRVMDRIYKLNKDEEGWVDVKSLKHQGKEVTYEIVGTVLEVQLNEPIQPGESTLFEMDWVTQVPIQIRRSGRDNKEGIRYSMTQWFPKMAEYDYQGWHAHPYIGREFHGVWGDFDVTIHIDKDYTVAASGVIQNPDEVGHDYSDKKPKAKKGKISYNFLAENVHDFAWSADPDYVHETTTLDDGTVLHFFYQPGEKTTENWTNLPKAMTAAIDYMNKRYGKYPYPQYTFAQGGDGGMEYAMITLITGERGYSSLVGVSVHEWMHSWYHMVLGSNESLYPWMDEGFTSFGVTEVMNYLRKKNLVPGEYEENPFASTFMGQANFSLSGMEEPLSTHADHYITNRAYGLGSYVKGQVFLKQLEYVVGKEVFDRALLKYYDVWQFKHPNPNDFIRIYEKESGLELDWYKEYMVNTTHFIDYAIDTVEAKNVVKLSRIGLMPMPVDVLVETNDGEKHLYTIPLQIMRGAKQKPMMDLDGYHVAADWGWTYPTYELKIEQRIKDVKKITIDPTQGMVDVDRWNNEWPRLPRPVEEETEEGQE